VSRKLASIEYMHESDAALRLGLRFGIDLTLAMGVDVVSLSWGA
jgi:hypothetical protein